MTKLNVGTQSTEVGVGVGHGRTAVPAHGLGHAPDLGLGRALPSPTRGLAADLQSSQSSAR